jgi:hypothetical protein
MRSPPRVDLLSYLPTMCAWPVGRLQARPTSQRLFRQLTEIEWRPIEVTDTEPDIPPHHAELAHFVAAAIAAVAIVPLLASWTSLGAEPGTEHWDNALLGLLALAIFYLLAIAFDHLGQAWAGDASRSRATLPMLLRITADVLVAATTIGIALRGPSARLLLAGFGEALPGILLAAAGSALISSYSWWRVGKLEAIAPEDDAQSANPERPIPRPRGLAHALLALLLIAGLVALEFQPLPRIDPRPAHAAPADP